MPGKSCMLMFDGPDHNDVLNPAWMRKFWRNLRNVWLASGSIGQAYGIGNRSKEPN